MKTITLTLPDEDFDRVATDARIHGRTVEAEIADRIKPVDWSRRPLITDRDELVREIDAFHAELRTRGVCLSDEELRAVKQEGRE